VGLDSSAFTGCLPTRLLARVGVSNPSDGKLSGRDGDVISVQYADLVPEIAISRTVVAVSTHTATVQIQPTIPVAGGVIRVTVADADLDVDALTADSAVVTLSASAGDSETLHLLETGNSTGVFTGSLLTAAGVLDTPGVLDGAAEGLTLTASFTDDLPDAGQIRVHTLHPQPSSSLLLSSLELSVTKVHEP